MLHGSLTPDEIRWTVPYAYGLQLFQIYWRDIYDRNRIGVGSVKVIADAGNKWEDVL